MAVLMVRLMMQMKKEMMMTKITIAKAENKVAVAGWKSRLDHG